MTEALSRLLAALVEGGKRADGAGLQVKERMVLEKFDGDISGLSEEERAKLEPEEVIVVDEDGNVDIWHKGDERARPA